MTRPFAALLLVLAAVVAAGESTPSPYTLGTKTADGIGRYFHGREIAHYMSHVAAPWLDRPEREREERPTLLIASLALTPELVVADFGCGSGYFALRMAPQVKTVIAADIQPEMLTLVRTAAQRERLANIQTIQCTPTDPKLPAASVDLILLVDVYHEIDHPVEVMTALKASLRPGGRIALVEYRGEDPTVPIKLLHKMTEAQARTEMTAMGFVWQTTVRTLPRQHLMLFGLPAPAQDGAPAR